LALSIIRYGAIYERLLKLIENRYQNPWSTWTVIHL